jgi:actin-like ATPase involved in cell morphogenesis
VPAELVELHDTIRAYRNTTVAHSQSELVTTWPVVLLDRQSGKHSVVGGTISQGLPSALAEDFSRLVEAMLEVLDVLIDEVRARLQSEANRIEMGSVPSGWQGLLSAPHTEFNPRTRRREYPVSQTLYASITSTEQPPEH